MAIFLLIFWIACAGGAGLGSQVPGLVALRGVQGSLQGFSLDVEVRTRNREPMSVERRKISNTPAMPQDSPRQVAEVGLV